MTNPRGVKLHSESTEWATGETTDVEIWVDGPFEGDDGQQRSLCVMDTERDAVVVVTIEVTNTTDGFTFGPTFLTASSGIRVGDPLYEEIDPNFEIRWCDGGGAPLGLPRASSRWSDIELAAGETQTFRHGMVIKDWVGPSNPVGDLNALNDEDFGLVVELSGFEVYNDDLPDFPGSGELVEAAASARDDAAAEPEASAAEPGAETATVSTTEPATTTSSVEAGGLDCAGLLRAGDVDELARVIVSAVNDNDGTGRRVHRYLAPERRPQRPTTVLLADPDAAGRTTRRLPRSCRDNDRSRRDNLGDRVQPWLSRSRHDRVCSDSGRLDSGSGWR